MGLDIYLYSYADFAAYRAAELAHEKVVADAWAAAGGWARATESQRAAIKLTAEQDAAARGLVDYETARHAGPDADLPVVRIEIPSARWPDHLCKIGYLRSSYNRGGYDVVAGDLLGPSATLDGIFDRQDDAYHFRPDWRATLGRARAVRSALSTLRRLQGVAAWYVQLVEIVIEMCKWVLGRTDKRDYVLHWSA